MLTLKMNHHLMKLQAFHNYEVARITGQHCCVETERGGGKTSQPEQFLATHWLSVTRERINSYCIALCRDIKMEVPIKKYRKKIEEQMEMGSLILLLANHI